MSGAASAEWRVSLSTLAAGPQERWRALAVVVISVLAFAFAAPFAKVPLQPQRACTESRSLLILG